MTYNFDVLAAQRIDAPVRWTAESVGSCEMRPRLFGAAMGYVLATVCVVSDFPDWI
jgi:hypothetical protein